MVRLRAIYGASGFGREVMPLARLAAGGSGAIDTEWVFIDDKAYVDGPVNGHRVLSYAAFLQEPAAHKSVNIAIAQSQARESIAARCVADGLHFFEVRAPNVLVLDNNQIGDGAIFCGFSHVTSNARIGQHFQANIYSYIAHDCVVGDYVTLAPGAKVNGNVVLEDHVYIGTGAIIKQGQPGKPTVIGRGAVIGMGAVVTRSVDAQAVVVGNPARPMQRN